MTMAKRNSDMDIAETGIDHLMRGAADPHHPWHGRDSTFWMIQFNRMIAAGVRPAAAYRYARTMMTGGVTREEAIAIIADRDAIEHRGNDDNGN